MFHSQCFLSRKGPLRSIWVAAYCFNKLKKSQVADTDISSSVDKVLQDEFDAVAYRVLAYFLLGIVRIYSKKVDYLFSDCNKVLVEVKDFAVGTSADASLVPFTAPHFTITLPESFQLDAFDLGILEDDTIGCNVLPIEDITLRDVTKRHAGSECVVLDKFHSMDVPCQYRGPVGNYMNDMLAIEYRPGTSSIEEKLEASVEANENCHQDSVGREMILCVEEEPPEMGTSYSRVCQPEDSAESHGLCMQKVWDDGYCEGLSLNVDMFLGIETKHVTIVESLDDCRQTEGRYSDLSHVPDAQANTHHGDPNETELIIEKFQDTTCLQNQPMAYEMCPSVEEPIQNFGSEHKDDAEPVDSLHTTSSRCLKRKFGLVYQRRAKKVIVLDAASEGDYNSGHVESSTEKLLDSRLCHEKVMQPETLSSVGGRPECAASCIKENQSLAEPIKSVDSGNAKNRLSRDDFPLSVTVDSTPESRFPNTSG
ncbi:Sister chromatid cohesion 1 protein 2 [Linum grandiflorum]